MDYKRVNFWINTLYTPIYAPSSSKEKNFDDLNSLLNRARKASA